MKNQKKNLKRVAVVSSALLSGSVIGLSPLNAETGSLFDYNTLGSGAELRSEIIDMNRAMEVSKVAESTSTIKFSELKCGEGKCGEEKKEKKAEGKKSEAKSSEAKSSEAKCGEGKCGEEKKKEEKKSEAKKESKASESKCGEGKCG